MNRPILPVLFLILCGLFVAVPGAWADEHAVGMIEAHADSVVSVKFVLNMKLSFHGQTQDREISGDAMGVLVDSAGLVILPGRVFNPTGRGRGGQEIDIQATPSDIRVIFPGDPKEYEAVLGATDSRLGLAFVRVKDLADREVRAVDLSFASDVEIGERLHGVSRLGQSFDFAPFCDVVDVVGHVTKPRSMWILRGRFTDIGHPLFRRDGSVAGFVIAQEGVGGGMPQPFLLPLGVAKSTIERAARESDRVLEEIAEGGGEEEAAPDETPEGASEEAPETAEPEAR